MPFIVIVIDELADLMASHGRDVEAAVVRLRRWRVPSVSISLFSTQRPSVDVITGLIKANITSRVAPSGKPHRFPHDPRCFGCGAFAWKRRYAVSIPVIQTPSSRRVQGALVAEQEVKALIGFIKNKPKPWAKPKRRSRREGGLGKRINYGG